MTVPSLHKTLFQWIQGPDDGGRYDYTHYRLVACSDGAEKWAAIERKEAGGDYWEEIYTTELSEKIQWSPEQ